MENAPNSRQEKFDNEHSETGANFYDYPIRVHREKQPELTGAELEAERRRIAEGSLASAEARAERERKTRQQVLREGTTEEVEPDVHGSLGYSLEPDDSLGAVMQALKERAERDQYEKRLAESKSWDLSDKQQEVNAKGAEAGRQHLKSMGIESSGDKALREAREDARRRREQEERLTEAAKLAAEPSWPNAINTPEQAAGVAEGLRKRSAKDGDGHEG